jgi:hypothetical protein
MQKIAEVICATNLVDWQLTAPTAAWNSWSTPSSSSGLGKFKGLGKDQAEVCWHQQVFAGAIVAAGKEIPQRAAIMGNVRL